MQRSKYSIIFLNWGFGGSWLRNLFLVKKRCTGSMHLFALGHEHHHLHGHLVHSTQFARYLSFWMLVSTVLSGASQSKFTLDLRMKVETSFAVWACWEIFTLLRGMHEWAFVVGTIRKVFTLDLFFAYARILFTDFLFQINSFLGVGGILLSGLFLIFFLSACVESLHSFLTGILSA